MLRLLGLELVLALSIWVLCMRPMLPQLTFFHLRRLRIARLTRYGGVGQHAATAVDAAAEARAFSASFEFAALLECAVRPHHGTFILGMRAAQSQKARQVFANFLLFVRSKDFFGRHRHIIFR